MPSINPRRSSKSASPPPRRNRQAEDGIRDDLVTGVQTCALPIRSEEHTSELQSPDHLVCRLLLDAAVAQLLHAFIGGIAFAPQHQPGVEAARCAVRRHQIHRHLGGHREAARHEVQHPGPGRGGALRHRTAPLALSRPCSDVHRATTRKTKKTMPLLCTKNCCDMPNARYMAGIRLPRIRSSRASRQGVLSAGHSAMRRREGQNSHSSEMNSAACSRTPGTPSLTQMSRKSLWMKLYSRMDWP